MVPSHEFPLYQAPADNLLNWTFLSAFDDTAENVTLRDPKQVGYTGSYWEVRKFFNLTVDGIRRLAGFRAACPIS